MSTATEPTEGNLPFPAQPAGEMESFVYDDRIVRMFAAATILWGFVATLVGLFVAILLVVPALSESLPWLAFGRMRPVHTNAALFAFVGNAVFAAVYYSTQRLCKARMWSTALSQLHFWGWQAVVVAGLVSLPLGLTQGKEFAEMQWPIDIAIAIVWVLFFGVNFFMTVARRRERHMYVTLWFYIATIWAVGLLHVVNNVVLPSGWLEGYSLYAGVQDAFMQSWYGHNMLAFFLTMPFLGLMYYFLPKAADRPVFSYKLTIVHFWSLVLLFVWAGPHDMHYTAMPDWATTLGMLFGLMLWMPSWAGVINGLMTLRAAWPKVARDPVLKFFGLGIVFYGLYALEEAVLSIKSVNALSNYTDWMIAHVHLGTLGWNGFMIFGMLYWLLPRIFQTKMWSSRLMDVHFWLGTVGILLYVLPIYAAGFVQAFQWRAMDGTGHLLYPDFLEIVLKVVPLWWLRVAGGAVFFIGVLILGWNALRTWLTRPAKYEQPQYSAMRWVGNYEEVTPVPASVLAEVPVLELGKKLDVWSKLAWHRRWERMPAKFTIMVMLAVLVATLVEALPIFLIGSNVPALATVQPYTPLELAGCHIYISEGCYNCHSQQIRALVSETMRYGEVSKPGEFIYDHPFQWGSRRIGPDLAREGGRQGSFWHWKHLKQPSSESEGSVMPSFEHLLAEDLNFQAIGPLLESAVQMGVPYTETELKDFEALARRQSEVITADIVKQGGPAGVFDKQAIALIAYLQRLGTDIYRTAEKPSADAAAEASEISESDASLEGDQE